MKSQKFIPFVFVAAGLLAYYNSFHCPFIFDDLRNISENPTITQLWPPWALLTHSSRPVVLLSLALNYALGGHNPWGYHAFNVGIHILVSLTLYGVIRRTLVSRSLRANWGQAATPVAATAALIWLVHPLQTESVTYTIQRGESLMGLFYLLTLYCVIRSGDSTQAKWWQIGAVTSCALGMASKPIMVTAPALVLLYDRVFLAQSWRELGQRRRIMYAGLSATWLLLALILHNGRWEWNESAGPAFTGIRPEYYALAQATVILHYIRLSFWPSPLCLDYGWTFGGSPAQMVETALPALIVVCGLIGATVWALCRKSALGFLGAWFFLILAPTSSFVPIADLIFEHRMYLPLGAVVTVAVLGTYMLSERLQRGRQKFGHALRWILAVSVVLMLARLTVRRNLDYASELAIWLDTVNKRPDNARAHNNLGLALWRVGKAQEAMGHWEQAILLKPDYADAHNDLGFGLSQVGRLTEGIAQCEQALRIKPDYAEAHNNLGIALSQVGRFAEAIAQYEQALRIKPDYAEAHNNLGIALSRTNRFAEGIAEYEQALRIKPDYAEAHYNLGLVLSRAGRSAEAVAQYEQALRIKSDYAEAHLNLAAALIKLGRSKYAIGHYEQALQIKPDDAVAYNNLAWLLATLPPAEGGDPVRAVSMAQHACELTGNQEAVYLDTLATAYAADSRFNDAIAAAQKAIGLARAGGQAQLVKEIEMRLELYRAGRVHL